MPDYTNMEAMMYCLRCKKMFPNGDFSASLNILDDGTSVGWCDDCMYSPNFDGGSKASSVTSGNSTPLTETDSEAETVNPEIQQTQSPQPSIKEQYAIQLQQQVRLRGSWDPERIYDHPVALAVHEMHEELGRLGSNLSLILAYLEKTALRLGYWESTGITNAANTLQQVRDELVKIEYPIARQEVLHRHGPSFSKLTSEYFEEVCPSSGYYWAPHAAPQRL
ncbi:hypothetical protein BJ170DRAFT_598132 [Xylariales sp. AK1849]|nr:hypothetical protein BJ170DRAFT_598132 [Xylariales sp. AK1849]